MLLDHQPLAVRELLSDDADALIKETRRRTRRRRGRIAVAVVLVGVAASYLVTSRSRLLI
jgi:hypothetical protein